MLSYLYLRNSNLQTTCDRQHIFKINLAQNPSISDWLISPGRQNSSGKKLGGSPPTEEPPNL